MMYSNVETANLPEYPVQKQSISTSTASVSRWQVYGRALVLGLGAALLVLSLFFSVAVTPAAASAHVQYQAQANVVSLAKGVNGNPWGYDFNRNHGRLIYRPNSRFCGRYFTCVSTFWRATRGYVVCCGDGKYSHSGGVRGACSHNRGVSRILYQH
jgi:hypothetical protein